MWRCSELRCCCQVQHLVQTAAEQVEQGNGISLAAGLPGRYGNHNPAGQRAERIWLTVVVQTVITARAEAEWSISRPTCPLGYGRRSRNRGEPSAPLRPELWCSPPGWTTAQSFPHHHCTTQTTWKTSPFLTKTWLKLTSLRTEREQRFPRSTSWHRGDLRRVLEPDVPPLWR